MEKRPNFYIILELDPSITDWSKIQAAIKKKQRSWALQKSQGSPTARRKAERYIKFIPEMQSLLKEPESRKQEAKAAAQEQKKDQQAQIDKLDILISILHTDTVSPDDVKLLVRHTGKVFSEKDIEDRLKQRGIRMETATIKKTVRPKLETAVAKAIRDQLDTLKLSSLYDFLNLDNVINKFNSHSSTNNLYKRADEIYKDLNRIGKTDPDTTLKMNLAGHAKSVFTNDSEKERYDNTLATEVLTKLDPLLEIAGRNKFIKTKDIESLLQAGKKFNLTEAIVMEYIEDYAAKRKWGIQKDTETTTIKLLPMCGYCNTLASSKQDKRCKNCGEELMQACPKCGKLIPTEDSACTHCGCHTGDAPLVKALLKDGKRLMAEGNMNQAISYFNRVLDYWADWQPALKAKKLAKLQRNENIATNFILTLFVCFLIFGCWSSRNLIYQPQTSFFLKKELIYQENDTFHLGDEKITTSGWNSLHGNCLTRTFYIKRSIETLTLKLDIWDSESHFNDIFLNGLKVASLPYQEQQMRKWFNDKLISLPIGKLQQGANQFKICSGISTGSDKDDLQIRNIRLITEFYSISKGKI